MEKEAMNEHIITKLIVCYNVCVSVMSGLYEISQDVTIYDCSYNIIMYGFTMMLETSQSRDSSNC